MLRTQPRLTSNHRNLNPSDFLQSFLLRPTTASNSMILKNLHETVAFSGPAPKILETIGLTKTQNTTNKTKEKKPLHLKPKLEPNLESHYSHIYKRLIGTHHPSSSMREFEGSRAHHVKSDRMVEMEKTSNTSAKSCRCLKPPVKEGEKTCTTQEGKSSYQGRKRNFLSPTSRRREKVGEGPLSKFLTS